MGEQGIRSQALSDGLELPDVCGVQCFLPFVRRAESELASAQCTSILSDECLQKLLSGLLRELVSCGKSVIEREISRKLQKQSPLYAIDIRLAPKALFDEAEAQVVDLIEHSGWQVFDDSAPLLHAVLARRVERFAATTTELCERIVRDRATLEEAFFDSRSLGAVTRIDYGDADSHDGGRRSCIVTCEAGSFAYKPHDCGIDEWFSRVAEKHVPGILRVPKAIAREDARGAYGFSEFVSRRSVPDEHAIARFWRRMGGACALFYLLGSQDLHGRNFVACGEFPTLIDIETVLAPEPVALGDERTCPNVAHALGGFTADLSQTLVSSGIHAKFVSGEGNLSPFFARNASCLPVWEGREYDVVGFEDEVSAGFVEACEMLLANVDELVRDVDSARGLSVRWVMRPTDSYGKLLARLRQADAYDAGKRAEILSVLHRAFEGDRGEGDWGEDTQAEGDRAESDRAEGDRVEGDWAEGSQSDAASALVDSEIASLLDGDVPVFRVKAGALDIQAGDGEVLSGLLATSAVDRSLARIESACIENEYIESACIESEHIESVCIESACIETASGTKAGPRARDFAVAVLDANLRFAEIEDESVCVAACEPADEPLSVEVAKAQAEGIFQILERMSVTSPSGCTAWLFRSYAQRTLTEPGNSFTNGVWGMAPFFAAFVQATRDDELRERALVRLDMCLSRIEEVVACLRGARRIPEVSVPLGLASGFGGMLRSLTLVGQVCEDGPIASRAEQLAFAVLDLIGRSDIKNAKYSSVYSGCAGLLMALCKCPWMHANAAAQEAAGRLVQRLVDLRTLHVGGDHVVWNTFGRDWAISGFGNGIAGVGAALALAGELGIQLNDAPSATHAARAAHAVREASATHAARTAHAAQAEHADRAARAARAALVWELQAYDSALGTWPDYRESRVGSGYVHGICSGAPGVGLAAIMASRSRDRELATLGAQLRELADAACEELAPARKDTLCCGCGSLVEYWLACDQAGDVAYRANAGRLLAGEVRRKEASGSFTFQNTRKRQSDDPSLFFGLSGLGYNLLRYANPSLPGIIV